VSDEAASRKFWVTYDNKWGAGKVHLADCRHADDNIRTGRWMEAAIVARLNKVDCKLCGGRSAVPA